MGHVSTLLTRWARKGRDRVRDRWQGVRLAWLVRALDRVPAGSKPPIALLERMRRVWGNEGWTAQSDYLAEVFQRVSVSDGAVLECGSGLSTLVLAAASAKSGATVDSLEHDAAWARIVSRRLRRTGLPHINVTHAPLRAAPDFDWYDAEPPTDYRYTLVVCDGPPGSIRGGRYGLLPVMNDALSPDVVVLLDDAGREAEADVMSRWGDEFGMVGDMVVSGPRRYARVCRKGSGVPGTGTSRGCEPTRPVTNHRGPTGHDMEGPR